MNYDEYRKIKALSNTGMSYLKRSPAHFLAWKNGELEDKPTPAQEFGIFAHCAILETKSFVENYTPVDIDGRTTTGKTVIKSLLDRGKIPIKRTTWNALLKMYDAVFSHPIARELVEESQHEVVRTWEEPLSGAFCKCRADCVGNTFIADVKTVADASAEAISKVIARYNFHRQAAFYMDAFKKQEFFLVVVEKFPPYPVVVYRFPNHMVSIGRGIYQKLARLYQFCTENNEWPGYSEEVLDVHLPAWAVPEDEEDIDLELASLFNKEAEL